VHDGWRPKTLGRSPRNILSTPRKNSDVIMKELPRDSALNAPDHVDEEAIVMQGTNQNTLRGVHTLSRPRVYMQLYVLCLEYSDSNM
jgi:hypothetical protein